jgi:hypothetical protein
MDRYSILATEDRGIIRPFVETRIVYTAGNQREGFLPGLVDSGCSHVVLPAELLPEAVAFGQLPLLSPMQNPMTPDLIETRLWYVDHIDVLNVPIGDTIRVLAPGSRLEHLVLGLPLFRAFLVELALSNVPPLFRLAPVGQVLPFVEAPRLPVLERGRARWGEVPALPAAEAPRQLGPGVEVVVPPNRQARRRAAKVAARDDRPA